jgi:hypothetical protein
VTELENLERKLNAQIVDYTTALGQGGCKDFGEYQRLCGIIYGLGLAKREVEDLRRKLERLDDE